MQNKKEISSVSADSVCMKSYPCQHSIKIKYKDGTEEEKHANGVTIAKKYIDYMNDSDKNHFAQYAKFSLFGKSQKAYDSGIEVNYDGMLDAGHNFHQ